MLNAISTTSTWATPTDCASCHMTDYNGTNNPPHAQAGFAASACATCHTPAGWDTSTFNHNQFFSLTNGHANLQCTQCHTGGNYANAPTTCAGCHMAEYNATNNPPHAQAGFQPAICSTCHDTIAWTDGKFDHNTQTSFPLTGKHIGVVCTNLPHDWRLQRPIDRLRVVPPHRLQRHQQSAARPGGVCRFRLRHLPHDCGMGSGKFQSQPVFPADQRARQFAVYAVPHEQQLRERADGMLRLSRPGLQQHRKDCGRAEPRDRQFPAGLHAVPHHRQLD